MSVEIVLEETGFGIRAAVLADGRLIEIRDSDRDEQQVTDVLDPEQVLLIPRQDLGNIPRMQRGLHSRGCKQIWLAAG